MAGRITRAAKGGGPTPPAGKPTNGVHAAALAVLPTAATSGAELVVESLAGLQPMPVRYLVPGRVPAGMIGLLAGEGGHGKSMTTLELAAAVTTGRCAFGLEYPDPIKAKALLVSCEDDWERTIIPRLVALGADLGRVLRVKGVRAKSGGLESDFHLGHFAELEKCLTGDPEIRLVVVDPAGAYVGRAGVNEARDADLRGILGPLSEMANRTGAAVLLIKHLNKSAGVSAVQRVSGSAGYVNAVRWAYIVAPDVSDPDRKLVLPIKANVLPTRDAGLAYRMTPIPVEEAKALLLSRWPNLSPADLGELASQLFRQAWEAGDIHADPNEVAAGGHQKRAARGDNVRAAAEFLREFLGGHSWPLHEAERAAEAAGHSENSVKKAKAELRRPPKTDPGRLSSIPRGSGDVWWGWIGPQSAPNPDRPEPVHPHTPGSHHTHHTHHTHQSDTPLTTGGLKKKTRETRETGECGESRQIGDPDFPRYFPGEGLSHD